MQIRLRSSAIATADNCRRMLQYQYILKVGSSTVSANLAFGRCIDVTIREYLRALTLGESLPSAVSRFRELWQQSPAEQVLVFSKTQNHATFERIGIALMRAFPRFWDAAGFEVAVNARGDPLLDVSLSLCLGSAYSAEDDRAFRRNVTDYSAARALAEFSTLAGHDRSRFCVFLWS